MARPLSPYWIYRLQLTSVLSILHRLTGMALAGGLVGLTVWLWALLYGGIFFEAFHRVLASGFGQVALMGLTFALFYHLLNGVRHLIWDAGYGYALSQVYVTGWMVVGGSLLFTVLVWVT